MRPPIPPFVASSYTAGRRGQPTHPLFLLLLLLLLSCEAM